MKVLIVDTDQQNGATLAEILHAKGMTVRCEREGTRGLERALSESFDLVVLSRLDLTGERIRALFSGEGHSFVPLPDKRAAIRHSDVLEIGSLRLSLSLRQAYSADRNLELTPMECQVLEVLMRSCGTTVSRDEISLRIHGHPSSPFDRTIDTHISRIRRKLGGGGAAIVSVRGIGYRFCFEEEGRS